jgi:disulfide bond formation protein DsbB
MRKTHLAICLTAVLCLSCSFLAEFALGKQPCALCWIQRLCWFLLIPASLIGPFFRKTSLLCALLLSANLFAASYQTLVSFHILQDRCKSRSQIENAAEYKELLRKNSCSNDLWVIAGAPVSAWNGVVSLAILGYLIFQRRAALRL